VKAAGQLTVRSVRCAGTRLSKRGRAKQRETAILARLDFTLPDGPFIGQRIVANLDSSLSDLAQRVGGDLVALWKDVHITVDESREITCECYPAWQVVRFSTKFIATVWGFALAYITLYQRYIAGRTGAGQVVSLAESAAETRLLRWATIEWASGGLYEFPEDQTTPETAASTPLNAFAINLATGITCLFVLHEVAHIRDGTTASDGPVAEFNCDEAAAHWLIDTTPQSEKVDGISVGAAAAILAIRELHRVAKPSGSHPPGHARLLQLLKDRFKPERDDIWAFVVAILGLHLTEREVDPPEQMFESLHEVALAYANLIADRFAQDSPGT